MHTHIYFPFQGQQTESSKYWRCWSFPSCCLSLLYPKIAQKFIIKYILVNILLLFEKQYKCVDPFHPKFQNNKLMLVKMDNPVNQSKIYSPRSKDEAPANGLCQWSAQNFVKWLYWNSFSKFCN